eukprot:3274268-Amphidinium_carterae.2
MHPILQRLPLPSFCRTTRPIRTEVKVTEDTVFACSVMPCQTLSSVHAVSTNDTYGSDSVTRGSDGKLSASLSAMGALKSVHKQGAASAAQNLLELRWLRN